MKTMNKQKNKTPKTKIRRYGVKLSREDVEQLGLNPDIESSVIKASVRDLLGLPKPMSEKQLLCEKLGLSETATAKEIRNATLEKL